MQFGIGPVEFLLLLIVSVGVPVGITVLLVRAVMRQGKSSKPVDEQRQLTAELDAAQLRLEDLEGQLRRAEEQARFTESLLEGRPDTEGRADRAHSPPSP